VLRSIARALNVSAETLLAQAGLVSDEEAAGASAAGPGHLDTQAAIRADAALTEAQKNALLGVYRSYLAENR
jgi:hypothetical protein